MNNLSIIICTYNDNPVVFERLLLSLKNQRASYQEVIVIDMSNTDSIKKICQKYPDFIYQIFKNSQGLSDSRNKGVELATTDLVAFLDADAIPEKDWAKNIFHCFKESDTNAIVGGKIIPEWEQNPNWIIKKMNVMKSFFSLLDFGETNKKVDRIFGANFAIRKSCFSQPIFNINLGRKNNRQLGGEETDLCKQAFEQGYIVMYCSSAVVKHYIFKKRISWRAIFKKAYYDGYSRALRKTTPSPMKLKFNSYDYIFLTLIFIPYSCGYFFGIFFRS